MKASKFSKIGLIIIGLVILGIVLYGYFINGPKFDKYGIYTIGEILKLKPIAKSGTRIYYSYEYNNRKYKGDWVVNSKIWKIRKRRILIETTTVDPTISSVGPIIIIPDSIKTAPPEGWKKLPSWAKKKNDEE